MPTPDVKGAASIIQRTGGLFSPYSIEASNTAFVAFSVLSARLRREAKVVHQPPRRRRT